jgi:hypothetical protein
MTTAAVKIITPAMIEITKILLALNKSINIAVRLVINTSFKKSPPEGCVDKDGNLTIFRHCDEQGKEAVYITLYTLMK